MNDRSTLVERMLPPGPAAQACSPADHVLKSTRRSYDPGGGEMWIAVVFCPHRKCSTSGVGPSYASAVWTAADASFCCRRPGAAEALVLGENAIAIARDCPAWFGVGPGHWLQAGLPERVGFGVLAQVDDGLGVDECLQVVLDGAGVARLSLAADVRDDPSIVWRWRFTGSPRVAAEALTTHCSRLRLELADTWAKWHVGQLDGRPIDVKSRCVRAVHDALWECQENIR